VHVFTISRNWSATMLSVVKTVQLGGGVAYHFAMPTRTQKKTTNEPLASRPSMPDYGIADAESGEGLLPWRWATEKLTKTQNYFLCTTRSDGRPHVMPIWGVWMDDAFYFSTGKTSVKARNLAENPRCVLCPGDADEAVIVEGVATYVTNKDV